MRWFAGRLCVDSVSSSVGPAPIRSRQRSRNPIFHFRPVLRNCHAFLSILCTFLVHLASKSIQKTIKVKLESNIWESFCLSVLVPFLVASWTCCRPLLRASETLWPSKGQGFLKPDAPDSQRAISQYRVFSHRGPSAVQKTTI